MWVNNLDGKARAAVDKAPDAFRTISEVAEELDLPQHVLRFWETRFSQIKPMKRGGGRRYYRPDDVDLLRGIRHLLYGEGYTIRGVQRILKDSGVKFVQGIWREAPSHGVRTPEDVGLDEDVFADAAGEEGSRGLLGLWPSILGEPAEMSVARVEPRLGPVEAGGAELPAAAASGPHAPEGGTRLSRENLRRLEAALFDLVECQRLLDAALANDA
jgi:DNA-binding transcriptional MerR regulator